jgi:hypothetical protein
MGQSLSLANQKQFSFLMFWLPEIFHVLMFWLPQIFNELDIMVFLRPFLGFGNLGIWEFFQMARMYIKFQEVLNDSEGLLNFFIS